MGLLDSFTPMQRNLMLAGVPVVGLAVIYTRSRPQPEVEPEEVPPPQGTIPAFMPTTDAIGTGTIAQWASGWTDLLTGIGGRLDDLEEAQATTPTTQPSGDGRAPHLRSDLGARQTQSRNVQPPGRGWPGETMSEIALRVYGSRGYANYIRWFNNEKWPGHYDKAIPAGTPINY